MINTMTDIEFAKYMILKEKYEVLEAQQTDRFVSLQADAIDFGYDYETVAHYEFVINTIEYLT